MDICKCCGREIDLNFEVGKVYEDDMNNRYLIDEIRKNSYKIRTVVAYLLNNKNYKSRRGLFFHNGHGLDYKDNSPYDLVKLSSNQSCEIEV